MNFSESDYQLFKSILDNELKKYLESISESNHYHLLSCGAECFHVRLLSTFQSEFYKKQLLSTESGDNSQ